MTDIKKLEAKIVELTQEREHWKQSALRKALELSSLNSKDLNEMWQTIKLLTQKNEELTSELKQERAAYAKVINHMKQGWDGIERERDAALAKSKELEFIYSELPGQLDASRVRCERLEKGYVMLVGQHEKDTEKMSKTLVAAQVEATRLQMRLNACPHHASHSGD